MRISLKRIMSYVRKLKKHLGNAGTTKTNLTTSDLDAGEYETSNYADNERLYITYTWVGLKDYNLILHVSLPNSNRNWFIIDLGVQTKYEPGRTRHYVYQTKDVPSLLDSEIYLAISYFRDHNK